MTVTDRPQINYAPSAARRRRRTVIRAIVGISLLLAGVFACWKCGPAARTRVALLYWQRQALDYRAPADQVVYDDDPSSAAQLLHSPAYLNLSTSGPPRAALLADPWKRFYTTWSPPGRIDQATLFLHERKNRRGETRLVAIETAPLTSDNLPFVRLNIIVVQPGTSFSAPQDTSDTVQGLDALQLDSSATHLRWFAGQPDPEDASHFTIRYELDGRPGLVDGWLRDEGGVSLEHHPLGRVSGRG